MPSDREQAERGSLILNRLIPAPDHGRGFRRDPKTGFVYYSSEWLTDVACFICGRAVEPEPRYFIDDGKPRHMLCKPST
jgi:hypothetical protein